MNIEERMKATHERLFKTEEIQKKLEETATKLHKELGLPEERKNVFGSKEFQWKTYADHWKCEGNLEYEIKNSKFSTYTKWNIFLEKPRKLETPESDIVSDYITLKLEQMPKIIQALFKILSEFMNIEFNGFREEFEDDIYGHQKRISWQIVFKINNCWIEIRNN